MTAGPVGLACANGHRAFPAADRCPVCVTGSVEEVRLSSTGTVEAVTGAGAYTVGEVRLDDGVLVLARLDGEPAVVVGDRVAYVPDEIVRFERHGS